MRNLIFANFSRLWKSKIFWLLELGTFLFSVISYLLVGVNVKNIGEVWILKNANFYFFIVLLYVGALTAIFSSLFFGTDYSDGILRNKLAVGHSRRDVYLSNWFLSAVVTILFMMTHYLTAVIVGVPAGGVEVISVLEQPLLKIVYSFIIALTYVAVFTLTTILDSNKARCAVINILLALVLVFAGFMIYSALEQPELKYQMVLQSDGSYLMQDNVPNPRHIGGSLRTMYVVAESILPAAFALRLASGNFSSYHIVGCIILTALLTVTGTILFKNKDIK